MTARDKHFKDICSRISALQFSLEGPDENWAVFRDAVYFSLLGTLILTFRRHQGIRTGVMSMQKKKKKKKKKKKNSGCF